MRATSWSSTPQRFLTPRLIPENPFWQRKRLQVLSRDGWACVTCGATEKTLHVHHKRYVKGLLPWEHDDADLASYCEACHADDHALRGLLDEMLARSTSGETLKTIVGIVGGFLYATYSIEEGLAERARDATGFNGISFDYGAFAAMCALAEFDEMAAFSESVFRRLSIDPDPIAADAIARWLSKQGAANS